VADGFLQRRRASVRYLGGAIGWAISGCFPSIWRNCARR
jgi:hypothetical protein